jgi:predicted alpha/beta hydrolase family esterase
MKKVFIVHGFEGSPNGGWRPWLMGELEKRSIYACALAMPSPSDPIPTEWVQEIARHVESNPRDHIYLVGHSLGVPAILRFLETTKAKNVKGIVLVSGPFFKTSKKKVSEFLKKPFGCKNIKSRVKDIVVIHGSDDRAVSPDQAVALAEALDGKLIVIKNGGHLNGSSGWFKLPQCLKSLDEMINN